MNKYKGISASPGLAKGPAFQLRQIEPHYERRIITDPVAEMNRLQQALDNAARELVQTIRQAEQQVGAGEAAIFNAQCIILEDEDLLGSVQAVVSGSLVNVEAAWMEVIETYAGQLAALNDEYLAARASDVRDVGQRVLRCLQGFPDSDLSSLIQPSVVLAKDLTPSDTIKLNKKMVLAFCTAEGGPTSHTAILAKAFGIPAVVGLGTQLLEVPSSLVLLVDGTSGEVIADPYPQTLSAFRRRQADHFATAQVELIAAHSPALTQDGHLVEIVANVGSVIDAETAIHSGAEGIGLLRTEFLYMNRQTAPTEDEQLAAYKAILEVMGKRPVVVRTLDIGGDKELPYIDLGQEENPFLGWRAIRMCLDRPDFFKVQLRALWRASIGHDLNIMFPMIATLDEVRKAKMFLEEARCEVLEAGHQVAEKVHVGIMVEIPAVSVLADLFAKEVDFFSIGTNDLTQYTMAADRANPKVAHLGDACYPAVLRQIQRVIKCGHSAGIWIGVCGELAGDPDAAPILLGLGLDEFSTAAGSIPHTKAIIRAWSLTTAQRLAKRALELDSAEAVRTLVHKTSHI